MTTYTTNIVQQSDAELTHVINNSKELTERTLRMRALSYYASVKAKLLTQTIYEVESSKKVVQSMNEQLIKQQILISQQKDELFHLNEQLKNSLNELKLTQDELLISSRFAASKDLLHAIAHQWRQPLCVLGLLIQKINDDYEEKLVDEHYIHHLTDKAMGYINYLSSTLHRFQTLYQPNELISEFNLIEEIESLIPLFSEKIQQFSIKITLNPQSYPIKTYKNELRTILFNILTNAIEALEKTHPMTSYITIEIEKDEQFDVINIHNNGGFIESKIINKIYEPYSTTKFESQGVGLGLFMSKIILEKHMMGHIDIKNLNDGVTCSLFIPHSS